MRNRMYGGVRGRKTKVGRKLLRFPPTRLKSRVTIMVIWGDSQQKTLAVKIFVKIITSQPDASLRVSNRTP